MKWLSIISWIAGAGMLVFAALYAWTTWTKAPFRFNSEGRYFDGFEVHLAQSVLGYATNALMFGLIAMACLWLTRGLWARGQN